MTFDDFNRIFCKGIFKEAMINVNQNFEKVERGVNNDVSLTVKIGEFQRMQMLSGLDP